MYKKVISSTYTDIHFIFLIISVSGQFKVNKTFNIYNSNLYFRKNLKLVKICDTDAVTIDAYQT